MESNAGVNNANNQAPVPIPPPNTLNAMRSTYMNLFNQILDTSFHINCICKTTFKSSASSSAPTQSGSAKCSIFDQVHHDFMSDDEDDDEKDESLMNDNNENDVEMQDNPLNESQDRALLNLDYLDQEVCCASNIKLSKTCDLSCFEHMRYIHSTFKNCFQSQRANERENTNAERFESAWLSLKFLSKNPKSCDYYGSTLFHYAASDNQVELLKCLFKKEPSGVFCIDSKGTCFYCFCNFSYQYFSWFNRFI